MRTAVYLLGHGPCREPRLIELQYLRILRYIHAFPESERQPPAARDVYVDINFPRSEPLAQLGQLCEAVTRGEYSDVYVDIDESPPFWTGGGLSFIVEALKEAGANVVNVFYKVEELLVQRFGEQCRHFEMSLNNESDFLAFFPALAGSAVSSALKDELGRSHFEAGSVAAYAIQQRVSRLKEANPYSGGRLPFIEDRLWKEIHEHLRKTQEEDRAARRQTEQLFRLGPNHAGVLIDEFPSWEAPGGTRSADELKLAEERLLRTLRFEKVTAGTLVSYERAVENFRLFADPRLKGKLQLYIYPVRPEGQEQRKGEPHTYSPPIQFLDVWKNDLESRLLAMIREQIKAFAAHGGHDKGGQKGPR